MYPVSVTEVFHVLVSHRQRFASVRDFWIDFLTFIWNRKCGDIHKVRNVEDWQAAWRCVFEDRFAKMGIDDSMSTVWFTDFDRRPDIVEALKKYLRSRGLLTA